MIGGIALVASALVAAIVARDSRNPYPTIEVKDLSPNGEQVLARLALSPSKQLVDSSVFASFRHDDLLWNDSLGVVIRKPATYDWGVSYSDSLETVSLSDAMFFNWLFTQIKQGFGTEALEGKLRFFAVRLDRPTIVALSAQSVVDSTIVSYNPFKDMSFFVRWVRTNAGGSLAEVPVDSLALAYREANSLMDSVSKAMYPLTRRLHTGVFVALVQPSDLATGIVPEVKNPLLDRAVAAVAEGTPTLLVVDRDRGTALFSTAVQLRHINLDGIKTDHVTFSRAGYAVERGGKVHVVMLQYLSSQPDSVLQELQRVLQSVRIRALPSASSR
jgi:hypothetical protein